mgnify:CR=1 FL=1
MALEIKKAERKQVYAKIALMAASGGGKTYSALRLATGMANEIEKVEHREAKILMLNTEGDRGYYYADEFNYDIVDVAPNHNPEKYVKLIKEVQDAGYDILIIDSASHEWEGKGGCLDLQAQAGGKYQDWAKITPRHQKFIDAISTCKMHVIATMRGKDQYDMSKDSNGKTSIQKLGVGAKQRDGFEYEFTCTFNIDQSTSMATPQKDNTHIFDEEGAQLLTEEHGALIIDWARKGIKVAKNKSSDNKKDLIVEEPNKEPSQDLDEVIADMSDDLPEEFETQTTTNEYPEDLFEVIKGSIKTLSKDKKLAVAKKVKEFGTLKDVPEEGLKEIFDMINA